MKKYLVILLAAIVMVGCNNEAERLQQEKDSLAVELDMRDSAVNVFVDAFNDIQDNLQAIKEKERIISMNTTTGGDVAQSQKDQINEDIILIYKLMLKNRQSMDALNEKLQKSNGKLKQFERMMKNLEKEMSAKDKEINSLKNELSKSYLDIEKLNSEIQGLNLNIDSIRAVAQEIEQEVAQKTEKLNTAYYVIGTKKELKEQQVISKKGGIIGIGGTQDLKDGFNKEYFTKIDIRKDTVFELFSKKVKILTTHPTASYQLEGPEKKVEKLLITNKDEFWGVTKYLVIMVD